MEDLHTLVADELRQPVDPRVKEIADAIAAKHSPASRAVLFYGSCLRESELEGRMLDFYLIVSDYRAAYGKRWLALANRVVPPNVFYLERHGIAAKYAVLSEADFAHECGPNAWTVSTAARFAQPSRLAWSADQRATGAAIDAVSQAVPTVLEWALPSFGGGDAVDLWKIAFDKTFAAELRAEREGRSMAIVDADPERYARFGDAALAAIARQRGLDDDGDIALAMGPKESAQWWRRMQRKGKAYSVVRLAKASATFAGGADYIAWKINRHAGTEIELKPWQRRHPLLAGITLLPRLLKSGAVR